MSTDTPGGEMRLWGGRFGGGSAPELDRINRSLPLDWRLWPYEVEVDRAWIAELAEAGVVDGPTRDRILDGLAAVEARLAAGSNEADDARVQTATATGGVLDGHGEEALEVRSVQHQAVGGAGKHVDTDPPEQNPLGFGNELIAWSD